jgi:hypothetical protein
MIDMRVPETRMPGPCSEVIVVVINKAQHIYISIVLQRPNFIIGKFLSYRIAKKSHRSTRRIKVQPIALSLYIPRTDALSIIVGSYLPTSLILQHLRPPTLPTGIILLRIALTGGRKLPATGQGISRLALPDAQAASAETPVETWNYPWRTINGEITPQRSSVWLRLHKSSGGNRRADD